MWNSTMKQTQEKHMIGNYNAYPPNEAHVKRKVCDGDGEKEWSIDACGMC